MRIITAALPYANGDLHLGHMLEYICADIHVRSLRMRSEPLLFICAEDTHGTPIELNAHKQGITPEQLIARYDERHRADFARFAISFDEYYTTNSEENKEYAERFFLTLNERGLITTRTITQLYCENDARFLPDRYVKGTCPSCKTPDQYGDVCEACGKTHTPHDLIDPACALCGATPSPKQSEHYFFTLSTLADQMREYLENASVQPEVKNYVSTWIRDGLRDWDITRDGPYFGFRIPGEQDKYFYVWLDAPIGYLSSLEHYKKRSGITEDLWNASHITHIIGKDIMYFHLLFWPAVLANVGYKQPDRIFVHGFLTVEKEKMSKSRGTFLTAHEFPYEPDLLRYYLASRLTENITDVNYSEDEFITQINTELIGNLMNMHYRILSLLTKKSVTPRYDRAFITSVHERLAEFIEHTDAFNHAKAIKTLLAAGDMVNRYIQERAPWKEDDPSETLSTAYAAASLTLAPLATIMPRIAERIAEQYGTSTALIDDIDAYLASLAITVNDPRIILQRIEKPAISPQQEALRTLDIRAARIIAAKQHPDADSLYVLDLDDGAAGRTIVSGLVPYYAPSDLEGKTIALIANLKPARIRGIESNGMLLAASRPLPDGKESVAVLEIDASPGMRILADTSWNPPAQTDIKKVMAASLIIHDRKAKSADGYLTAQGKPLHADQDDEARIH